MEKIIKKQNLLFDEFKNAIKNFGKDSKRRKTEAYLKKRKERADKFWSEFETNHKIILESASAENITTTELEYFTKQVFSEAEEMYLFFIADIDELLFPENLKKGDTSEESFALPEPNDEKSSLKLPRITMPRFSGDYASWTSFRDLFVSLIHSKQSLSKAEKLHYLKASLSGEAERLIQGFAITESNYDTAWEILTSRYENKRMLVNSQLDILFSQTHCTESSASVKKLLDTTIECVQALQNLKITHLWDTLIVYMTSNKLSKETLQLWEQQIANLTDLPTFDTLKSFLATRFRTLEAVEKSKPKPTKLVNSPKNTFTRQQTFLAEQRFACGICGDNHLPKHCQRFLKLKFNQRNETIRRLGLCVNCLNRGHLSSSCPSKFSCNHCGKRHHSLMHIFPQASSSNNNTSMNATAKEFLPSSVINKDIHLESTNSAPLQSMHVHTLKEVLLATALVTLSGPNGQQTFRALLDQGSQASFITEHAVQSLGLQRKTVHAVISGIGQSGVETTRSKAAVKLIVPSHQQTVTFDAFILKKIAGYLPAKSFISSDWAHLDGLQLADPTFNKPGRIDLLLGADLYASIVLEGLKRGSTKLPLAQNTIFGWVLIGEYPSSRVSVENVLSATVTVSNISEQLKQFWTLEEVPHGQTNIPDDPSEKFFLETHKRLSDGTYCVKLPFVDNIQRESLGASRHLAVSSLLRLEQRFGKDEVLKREYNNCINEYLQLGHMNLVTQEKATREDIHGNKFYDQYYLPHHAVFKDSSTTKLRVVFNASRKTTSGISLNDILITGPAIQNELVRVLFQWRWYQYSFISDIEKMYRQVKVHPDHRDYQRIVWRNNPTEDITDYCLTTVTFGVTCAPFLAIRVLKQLAHDECQRFPLGAKTLIEDFYVDDCLSGAETIQEAVQKQKELNDILLSGGFRLRKWVANDDRILESIPAEDRANIDNVDLNLDKGIKSLGLIWFPKSDTFGYKVGISTNNSVNTKRELLSEVAKLYDPLGWISPIITSAKILMQAVWIHGLDWDEMLPSVIKDKWDVFKQGIPELEKIRIPRWLKTNQEVKKCELHAFSDASQHAYAAVVYVKTTDKQQNISTRILVSKSKVAPVKTVSIPRLELCGVVLAARLIKFVKEVFIHKEIDVHLWTDSMIVLSWLNNPPCKWTTFISHRTSEILDLIGDTPRHHVPSHDNPADLASRGSLPIDLIENKFWWCGPDWLILDKQFWPKQPEIRPTELEKRKTVLVNLCVNNNYLIEILNKYSSLLKLLRITVYCFRFIMKLKRLPIKSQWITSAELEKASQLWIRVTQQCEFKQEIYRLKEGRSIDKGSKLLNLNPFLDGSGLLRVGGRLQNSNLPYNQQHPLILPKIGHLVELLLRHFHVITLHGGTQLMLTTIRKRYWLLNARNVIRHFIHRCITCYRNKPKLSAQLMGNLPSFRVTKSRPFTNTGVDYCGPVQLRMSKHRGSKIYKGYIAIFVCLAVKAVHIEPVSDMTTAGFLAAFRRFTARRGLCKNLYSDCGTNFIGADAVLRNISKENNKAAQELAHDGINWHFIPPAAPHFGGIWESGVKSAKHHLKRVLSNATLTFEELYTVLSQIEACMNSRPLCPLTADTDDLSVLTPGHFLIGDSLLAPPQEDLLDVNENHLDRWRLLQKLLQHFWNRWSKKYLHLLQQRSKWDN